MKETIRELRFLKYVWVFYSFPSSIHFWMDLLT